MSARKYVAVRTVGRRDQILERITRAIQRLNLAKTTPLIKIEKKASREFYMFLAVDGYDGKVLSDDINNIFLLAGIRGEKLWPLSDDNIKKMTSSVNLDVHSFSSLKYRSLWSIENYYMDIEETFEPDESTGCEQEARYDRLLYWLSVAGKGSWNSFVNACEALGFENTSKGARNAFRRLRLLGHVECSEDGTRWHVCPPCLVLSADQKYYYLCGQRTPSIIEHLSQLCSVEKLNQPLYEGPKCIRFDSTQIDNIQNFQKEKDYILAGPAALRLAKIIPELDEWKTYLTCLERINLYNYEIEKWNGCCYSRYEGVLQNDRIPLGLYRLIQNKGKYQHCIHLYFDESQRRWLKGDWYGLHFLNLYENGEAIDVGYDPEKEYVIIPKQQHWPYIYEKTLVLASGLLPAFTSKRTSLLYSSIPKSLIDDLVYKIDAKLEEIQDV
jgi:hypothetical protein